MQIYRQGHSYGRPAASSPGVLHQLLRCPLFAFQSPGPIAQRSRHRRCCNWFWCGVNWNALRSLGVWARRKKMPTRTEPKINKWAKRDERTTNGQTDKWTNGRASKLDSTGALITVMASALSTDTKAQIQIQYLNSYLHSYLYLSARCAARVFGPKKRGWLTGDGIRLTASVTCCSPLIDWLP